MNERVQRLHNLLTSYLMHAEVGDSSYEVWPEDDDGGEHRVGMCLRTVLPNLDEEGLMIVEKELLD